MTKETNVTSSNFNYFMDLWVTDFFDRKQGLIKIFLTFIVGMVILGGVYRVGEDGREAERFKKLDASISQLAEAVVKINQNLVEYKINAESLPKIHRDMIFIEISITAEATAMQNKNYIMEFIKENRKVSPNSVWIINPTLALASVGKEVQKRLLYEYDSLTERGVDPDVIALCKHIDTETFPKLANSLRNIVDRANMLNTEGKSVEYIEEIMEEKRINILQEIKSDWFSRFNEHSSIKD